LVEEGGEPKPAPGRSGDRALRERTAISTTAWFAAGVPVAVSLRAFSTCLPACVDVT
jgi:hypothetical protein